MKPVYYSLRVFLEKVVGADRQIGRLELGEGITCFRFEKAGEPFYLLWSDSGWKEIAFPIDAPRVEITRLIAKRGQMTPDRVKAKTNGEQIKVKVGPMPIFIEPRGDSRE